MATIVTRAGKGSPLTNTEVDDNFLNLNTDKAELSGATFTGEIVAPSLDISGDIDVDGTTNLDVVDIDGAVDMASTLQVDGAATFTTEITANGGIALGDSDKATFGDAVGGDLQIYHDGNHSYIQDAGTGNLYLAGDTNVGITNSAGNEWKVKGTTDGAVELYYNNTQRLATTSTGIDVTGTAEAHKVEIGDGSAGGTSEILFSDNVSARGKILYDHSSSPETMLLQTTGTTAISIDNSQNISIPNGNLDVTGTADVTLDLNVGGAVKGNAGTRAVSIGTAGSVTGGLQLWSSTTGTSYVQFGDEAGTAANHYRGYLSYNHTNDSMSLGTSGSTRVTIDSSGAATIEAATGHLRLQGTANTNKNISLLYNESGDYGQINCDESGVNQKDLWVTGLNLKFGRSVSSESMRISSDGSVGIGNSAPLGKLTISNAAGTNAPSTVTAANTYLQLGSDDYGPSNNGKFMIGFGFTDATNTNSPAYIGYEEASTSGDTYGDLTFYTRSVTTDTAPTERLRISSDGSVGIGTDSPSTQLHQIRTGSASDLPTIATETGFITQSTNATASSQNISIISGNAGEGRLFFGDTDDEDVGNIVYNHTSNYMSFDTNATERMRIESDGNVRINDSLDNITGTLTLNGRNTGNIIFQSGGTEKMRLSGGNLLVGKSDTGDYVTGIEMQPAGAVLSYRTGGVAGIFGRTDNGETVRFTNNSSIVGTISTTGSATSYNTSSDQRLKENIADADDAGSKIDSIQVRKFDWKADGLHQDYGMIAQELLEVAPEAVSQGETEDVMMGVDYSKLVPMLIKEIQSLRNRVAQLEE